MIRGGFRMQGQNPPPQGALLDRFEYLWRINLTMEPEESHLEELQAIHANKNNARAVQHFCEFIKQCKAKQQDALALLNDLNAVALQHINFHDWADLARALKRGMAKPKNQEKELRVGDYIVRGANHFCPGPHNHMMSGRVLKVAKNVRIRQPENFDDSIHVTMYLQTDYDKDWGDRLVEYINDHVIVDKKNVDPRALKLNPYFANFVSRKFARFVRQLERLMVRSESNLEVLAEFMESVGPLHDVGELALELASKYKHLFLTKPDSSLRLQQVLALSLNTEHDFLLNFEFIRTLLVAQHNAKKKIIYLRMFLGFIQAIKKHRLPAKLVNQMLSAVATSWTRFGEQPEAICVLQILKDLLPLCSQPGPEIAQACKSSFKSQNRYILTFLSLTLAVYDRQTYFEEMVVVRQAEKALKEQLETLMKKKEANWHLMLPMINFVSVNCRKVLEFVKEMEPLFQSSCLVLSEVQQQNALSLLFRFIRYLEEEEGIVEFPCRLAIAVCVLLEESGEPINNFLKGLKDAERYQLIGRGIHPLLYFETSKTNKNRDCRFVSLARKIFSSCQSKLPMSHPLFEQVMTVGSYCALSMPTYLQENSPEKRTELTNKYFELSLYDTQADDKAYLSPQLRRVFTENLDSLVQGGTTELMHDCISKLFSKRYYEDDYSYVEQLENSVLSTVKQEILQRKQLREHVIEMGYCTEKKIAAKKVYLGTVMDVKMMNEAEVKQQRYQQHFQKMIGYVQKITSLVLRCSVNQGFIQQLWETHFDHIVHIVTYPQHRLYVYRIVKASFQHVTVTKQLTRLSIKYSQFLAEFYAVRGAHVTPEVTLMQKSHKFITDFHTSDHSQLLKQNYLMRFVNDLCLYILENMEFDLSVKEQALAFLRSAIEQDRQLERANQLYTFLVKNINIISSNPDASFVLQKTMEMVGDERYTELFVEILNYIKTTQRLILSVLSRVNEAKLYDPSFEDYIKLRILSLDSSDDAISGFASNILNNSSKNVKSIANFDMKNFVRNNTKDTIQKLCKFMTEETNAQNINELFSLILRTANELYDEHFDQEGLEFLPYYISINAERIPQQFLNPIFETLVLKYTANEDYQTLSRMAVEIGIDIIKRYADRYGEKLLMCMESFLNRAKGISNIVFLGVLAPYIKGNKNLNVIEKRITELFQQDNESEQRAIAKSMSDLMSFFQNPDEIVSTVFHQISTYEPMRQKGQAYLISGLLKGLGHKKTMIYVNQIIAKDYPSKSVTDKSGRVYLLNAFVENFGRVIELKAISVIQILLGYMSDSSEQIRNSAKKVAQTFVTRMSSFAIRELLPFLLTGLENEQNWRVKISYIWILGIMANCAAKQLQASLPIIVPTLSTCLSNAHPTIREKAAEALNLIGETIKNPEISQTIDILIEALENPFEKSSKAIDLLLKTKFSHYIDPPSLSLIIPIIDYCLRGRVSELKEGACQVLGSISELIFNPSDILPYLKIVSIGIKTAICDPLPEIRSIAAMAIGRISAKIGAEDSQKYFHFIFQLIDSSSSNTTEKTGAAQAYAQILCSQDYDYFEESLNFIFSKLSAEKQVKEGYILTFLYVPAIRKTEFEAFIKEVNENTYCYVSDEEESLRNSSMQVSKVLINNYGISHTELLLEPLCNGIFEENWRKRNAALILLGELINILKGYMFHNKTNDKADNLYQAMMAIYIEKDDDLEMPRVTANQVWNMYIENTPKTIKSGLYYLVRMWTKFTHCAGGVVFKNIVGFSGKYGENYFTDILEHLDDLINVPENKKGVFEILGEFIKRLSQQFLTKKAYRDAIRNFFDSHIFSIEAEVSNSLTRCFALYVEKMNEQTYFEELIYPQIDKMEGLNQEDPLYTQTLHLLKDLLNASSGRVVNRLITKITQPPLSEFKIEVITNNADKIANNLYTLFKQPATESMLEEIFTLLGQPERANRLALLVYCLNQVSTRLLSKFKNAYVNMLVQQIRAISSGNKKCGMQGVEKLLQMLVFFLNSISLSEIDSLEQVIGEVTPYLFKGSEVAKANAHRTLMILISDPKSAQTGSYYKQLIVSLENNREANEGIWTSKDTAKEYMMILVKGLAYGNPHNLLDNLHMLNFFIKNTPREIIAPFILRIIGPVIRVASYPLTETQKESVLQFLTDAYLTGYDLEVYNHQIVSVCLRMLIEQRNSKKAQPFVSMVSKTLFKVLQTSLHRQILLDIVFEKVKTGAEIIVETLINLLETIIKEDPSLFPTHTYEVLRHEFYTIISNNQLKNSVKATYYMAQLCALMTYFLKQKAPQKLDSANCTYEDLLINLHLTAYHKEALPILSKVELFIKESPREKVYSILKILAQCKQVNARTSETYTHQYVKSLIPQALSGFDDIIDVLEYFDEY